MCGIAGIVAPQTLPQSVSIVEQVAHHQIPRGPDVLAVYEVSSDVPHVVLGHNRLSIIDLSKASDQPMWDVEKELCIAFNGEIYNFVELRTELEAAGYRFQSKGDTEVILAAYRHWGTKAFSRFLGMFAFALYDYRTKNILLVRDRFGVKPLMYHWRKHMLAFASSGLALAEAFRLSPRLDYVARGTRSLIYEDETSLTAFEKLEAVEPGTFIEVSAGGGDLQVAKHRYYHLEEGAGASVEFIAGMDDRGRLRKLEEILLEAVNLRLRSDVEVGLSLSGGIDSSLVACLCAELGVKLRAFSFGELEDGTSEASLVDLLSRKLGLELEFIAIRKREELEEVFWRTLAAQEAPFAGPSVLAQHAVFKRVRDSGVRVLLGGQGGDEGFMGYHKFFLFHAEEVLRRRALSELPQLLLTLGPLPLGLLRKARSLWRDRGRYLEKEGVEDHLLFPGAQGVNLGLEHSMTLSQRQILDATRLSLPTLLRYEDRNSAGNSVESRLPLVDHRVVEFGVALPVSSKLRFGRGKWILRSLLSRRAPAQVAWNRVKRGFDVNERKWISLGLGSLLRDAIKVRRPALSDIIPEELDVDRAFSDASLLDNRTTFAQAVSLIWIADRVGTGGTDLNADPKVPTGITTGTVVTGVSA